MDLIEFKNTKNPKSSSQKKAGKGRSPKKPAARGYNKPSQGMGRRPPTASKPARKVEEAQAMGGWNNSTVLESKFFDKSQDKEFMRRASGSQHKARSVKFQDSSRKKSSQRGGTEVTKDGTNMQVKFYT